MICFISEEKAWSKDFSRVTVLNLLLDPLLGSGEALNDTVCLLCEQSSPVLIEHERLSIANDDEAVLGARDADIDAILLLHEAARSCTHHRDENQVEFSTLRAVDRENLVLDTILGEVLSYGVLLRVVGRDHVDAILRELLDWEARDLGCNAKRVSHDAKAVFF